MGGQIIDAFSVAVPKQRNNREENAASKAGKSPTLGHRNRQKAVKKTRLHGELSTMVRIKEPVWLQKPPQGGPSAQIGAG